MERKREVANFVVKYNSDPRLITNNHESEVMFLTDTDERNFNDQGKAIIFLMQCRSPITTIEQLVPELKGKKKFNYLLPERNIRPKHQLSSSLELRYIEEDW